MTETYDTHCYDLALFFLEDCVKFKALNAVEQAKAVELLATEIQEVIESFCTELE